MKTKYIAYLLRVESDDEVHVGEYLKLSPALVKARCACRERGVSEWDWVVDKYEQGELVNRRSSLGGLES